LTHPHSVPTRRSSDLLVAEVAEQNAAERPGNEADGEARKGEQRRDSRVLTGEEELPEYEGGKGSENEEVVILQYGSDGARGNCRACGVGRRRRAGPRGAAHSLLIENHSAEGTVWDRFRNRSHTLYHT